MLMGEHAVVYGYPSLVTAVDKRLTVQIDKIDSRDVEIIIPETGDTRFVNAAIKVAQESWHLKFTGLKIQTNCDFCGQYGFGSSSAVTVAMIYALSLSAGLKITKEEIFKLSYKTILDIQGVGSGFDVAAATYGGTIYYQLGKPVEKINISSLPLVIGYTGIKADTVKIVKDIAQKRSTKPDVVNRIFEAIGKLVEQAKIPIAKSDWLTFGKFCNFNQEYLRDLGVSSEILESLIVAANTAGAYGAKLSGAGGGDCMIAVAPIDKRQNIINAIKNSGGQIVEITANAPGVREENE